MPGPPRRRPGSSGRPPRAARRAASQQRLSRPSSRPAAGVGGPAAPDRAGARDQHDASGAVVPQEPAVARGPTPGTAHAGTTAAAAGILVEALGLGGVAVVQVVHLLREGSPALSVGLFLVLFCLTVAAALVAAARGLRRGSRSARSALITWQLLQGATAAAVLQVAGPSLAPATWAALGLAGAVLVLLVLSADRVRR